MFIRTSYWHYVCVYLAANGKREDWERKKIRLIESKSKCRHLKKFSRKGTVRQVFICLRPPPLLGFCLGWSSNFLGSESGQIQSVKILRWPPTQLNTPPPHPLSATYCLYILFFDRGKGVGRRGEVNIERRLDGHWAIVHKAGSKIPTWLTVSPVYKP